jgi:ribosomal protein S18 acetylase RimI-like enzyme
MIYPDGLSCQTRRMAGPPEINVRAYRPGDRRQVMALAPRLTAGSAPWRSPADMLPAVLAAVRNSVDAFRAPGHAVYVAAAGEDIVGLVTIRERTDFTGQREAYVEWLAVQAGMERRGIATKLMVTVENWAVNRGLSSITLETGAANHPARRLYQVLGYEEEDIRVTKHSITRQPREP